MTDEDASGSRSQSDSQSRISANWTEYESPAVAIVSVTAIATDRSVTEIDPLERYIQTDALNAILTSRQADEQTECTLSYDGVRIRIDGAGDIDVWPADDHIE